MTQSPDVASADSLAGLQFHLLRQLMRAAPSQPATNLWRAIELPVLADAVPRVGSGLDVGCGDGALTRILRDMVQGKWQLVGVDPDPAEVSQAVATGIYRDVHTVPADDIPEADNSFDFAFANSVLEHIPNFPDCLAEVARCLKPGGLFVATVPSDNFHNLLRAGGRQGRDREEYLHELDRRLAHMRYWSPDRWGNELQRAGFELPTVTGYLTARQTRRWERWSNWTGGLLFRLKKGRQQPIEIQRGLRLRRPLFKPLAFLAGPLAGLVSRGVLGDGESRLEKTSCQLIVARKRLNER